MCKNAEKEYEQYIIQGDTIKKCKHEHKNILLEGCDNLKTGSLADKYNKAMKTLFTEEEEIKQEQFDLNDHQEHSSLNEKNSTYDLEVPQNELGLLDIDSSFDFVSVLQDELDRVNIDHAVDTQPFSVQTIQNDFQNEQNTLDEFPLELLSGVFKKEEVCHDFHHNQLSFYKCHFCNPATFKDYENWKKLYLVTSLTKK